MLHKPYPDTAGYDIGKLKTVEKLPPGADAVLFHVQAPDGREYCLKEARRWPRGTGEHAPLRNQVGTNPPYALKKKHFLNEYSVARDLLTDEAPPFPPVRSLIERKFFGIEWGCDLLLDYLHGSDLGQMIHRHQPDNEASLINILFQAAHALRYIHEHNYLHLDVKPHNFIATQNSIFIIDFGSAAAKKTAPTTMTGTIGYLAPEQLMADGRQRLDQRADVYGFGIMANELFGGSFLQQEEVMSMTTPSRREWAKQAMRKEKSFIDISSFQKGNSTYRALGDLVAACTTPTPKLRPQQMKKIIDRLTDIANQNNIELRPPDWNKDLGLNQQNSSASSGSRDKPDA